MALTRRPYANSDRVQSGRGAGLHRSQRPDDGAAGREGGRKSGPRGLCSAADAMGRSAARRHLQQRRRNRGSVRAPTRVRRQKDSRTSRQRSSPRPTSGAPSSSMRASPARSSPGASVRRPDLHLRSPSIAGTARRGSSSIRPTAPCCRLTDEARQRAQQRPSGLGRGVSSNINPVGPFNSYEDPGLDHCCITRGIPNSMMPAGYGSFYEIIQGQESVSLRNEMIDEHRVVPIERGGQRSPHLSESHSPRLGDARGRDQRQHACRRDDESSRSGAPSAARAQHLKMTERFTPVAPNVLELARHVRTIRTRG